MSPGGVRMGMGQNFVQQPKRPQIIPCCFIQFLWPTTINLWRQQHKTIGMNCHELACVSGWKNLVALWFTKKSGPRMRSGHFGRTAWDPSWKLARSHLRQRTNRPAPRHFKVSCLDKGLAKCEDHMSWVSLEEDWRFDIQFWCPVLL